MKTSLLLLSLLFCTCLLSQQPGERIHLNQVGYYPVAPKEAVIVGYIAARDFYIKQVSNNKAVFNGQLSAATKDDLSETTNQIADFSTFQKPGHYYVEIPDLGRSYTFEIKENIFKKTAIGALKGFYYQRTSEDLPAAYAGKWARAAGHPDTQVYVHGSAATAERPEGTIIASPYGWYDAGDYNKYIVNSGISVATLLSLYEDFKTDCKPFKTNIPESKNALPDVLDEALFNIRWMVTMQDPNDGGVYHKLTNARFDPLNMAPSKATTRRFVVQKSTAATLDFAAVLAQASRVFKQYERQLPHFADSCRLAAEYAWQWASRHPDVMYDQEAMNKLYEPDIVTGEYGDRSLKDEWIWAAIELWAATNKAEYKDKVDLFPDRQVPLPAWNDVRTLGYYTLLRLESTLPSPVPEITTLKKSMLSLADSLVSGITVHPFHTVMGRSDRDYCWGSSSVAANQGIFLIQVYKLSRDQKYLKAALTNLDYLLGRNATGYCFLTGFGQKQVMYPHHRPSVSDEVVEPVPGLLSGGPNPGQQDKCPGYSTRQPDKSYLDADCSYSTNEIAINWNAPMVYLAMAMEILQNKF